MLMLLDIHALYVLYIYTLYLHVFCSISLLIYISSTFLIHDLLLHADCHAQSWHTILIALLWFFHVIVRCHAFAAAYISTCLWMLHCLALEYIYISVALLPGLSTWLRFLLWLTNDIYSHIYIYISCSYCHDFLHGFDSWFTHDLYSHMILLYALKCYCYNPSFGFLALVCPLSWPFSYNSVLVATLLMASLSLYTLHMHFFLYCLLIFIVYMYPLLCYLLYFYFPYLLVLLRVDNMLRITLLSCFSLITTSIPSYVV